MSRLLTGASSTWAVVFSTHVVVMTVGITSNGICQRPSEGRKVATPPKPEQLVFRLASSQDQVKSTFSRVQLSIDGHVIFVARDIDNSVYALARDKDGT